MKTSDNVKAVTNTAYHRSYFAWSCNMQVVRKGHGEVAMTESELTRFFGVTWRKLNHRLQTIMKSSDLHPDERSAGEEAFFISGCVQGYAPLYPLPMIITLSFLLDSTEAHLFRNYICQRLQKPTAVITPIFLLDTINN